MRRGWPWGEMARRSGVAVSTLHFYEREGLIHSERSAGNQRRYRREALRVVAMIRVAQRVGIPLQSIRQALAHLPNGRKPTLADWRRLSAAVARRTRRTHHADAKAARSAHRLHRLRMPLDPALPAAQSG